MNPHEDFRDFSAEQFQRIQAIIHRMQAIYSLLDFFNNYHIRDRRLANNCQSIISWLKTDLEDGMRTLSQIFEVED